MNPTPARRASEGNRPGPALARRAGIWFSSSPESSSPAAPDAFGTIAVPPLLMRPRIRLRETARQAGQPGPSALILDRSPAAKLADDRASEAGRRGWSSPALPSPDSTDGGTSHDPIALPHDGPPGPGRLVRPRTGRCAEGRAGGSRPHAGRRFGSPTEPGFRDRHPGGLDGGGRCIPGPADRGRHGQPPPRRHAQPARRAGSGSEATSAAATRRWAR